MIRYCFLFLLAFSCSGLFAQDDEDNQGRFDEQVIGNTDSRDRLIMELNWNRWLNTPDSFNVQNKSRGFNFYFFYDIAIGGENVAIAPGIGISNSNIFHDSFLGQDTDSLSATFEQTLVDPFSESLDFKKNKISLTYLEIPIEVRFRTNANDKGQRFKIGLGFKGGLLINSHSKYVGDDTRAGALPNNPDFVKYKEHKIPNLRTFRYGATARVGYGSVNLHAYYGVSTVFETDKGPEANSLEIGISFNPF
ncbi:MAG: hypothetical protein ACI959_000287 [Limisphaerales bacterium]|jgi:hypothetical protein